MRCVHAGVLVLSQALAGCFIDTGSGGSATAPTAGTSGGPGSTETSGTSSEAGTSGATSTDAPTTAGTCASACGDETTVVATSEPDPSTTNGSTGETTAGEGVGFVLAGSVELQKVAALAAGSLDGDAGADLVAVGEEGIHVIRGANLAEPETYPGDKETAVVLLDVDGDMNDDVVTAGDNGLRVYRNDKELFLDSMYAFPCPTARGLAVGEIDPGGHGDVVLGCSGGGVLQLAGTLGGFAMPMTIAGGADGVGLVDVNGDGHLDLLYIDTASKVFAMVRGNGTLAGWDIDDTQMFELASPVALGAGDVDGDGFVDVVVASGVGQCQVFPGSAGGLSPGAVFACADGTRDVALGDLDVDGLADVVTVRAGAVDVMFSGGGGAFETPETYMAGPDTGQVALADYDGDGRLDIAVTRLHGILMFLQEG